MASSFGVRDEKSKKTEDQFLISIDFQHWRKVRFDRRIPKDFLSKKKETSTQHSVENQWEKGQVNCWVTVGQPIDNGQKVTSVDHERDTQSELTHRFALFCFDLLNAKKINLENKKNDWKTQSTRIDQANSWTSFEQSSLCHHVGSNRRIFRIERKQNWTKENFLHRISFLFRVQKDDTGKSFFVRVCDSLQLEEKDYFALKYFDREDLEVKRSQDFHFVLFLNNSFPRLDLARSRETSSNSAQR